MTATTDQGVRLVRQLFTEVFNQGRLELIKQLVDPEFVNFGRLRGQRGLEIIVGVWRAAFPDLHIDVEEEIAVGETVVVRVTCSGTHAAELRHLTMGILPATGRRFSVEHIHIFKIRDGKIVEHRACRDDLGMLQQLQLVAVRELPTDASRAASLEAALS